MATGLEKVNYHSITKAMPKNAQTTVQLHSSHMLAGIFLVAQMVKHLSAMQEIWVQSLGWEYPLEKEMATNPVPLPRKSHGRRSLVGYSPWGRKESDTNKQLHFHFFTCY